MRLRSIELYRVDLAFRSPVITATGAHTRRPLAFVRVVAEEAEGWGECAALADGTCVDPPFDAVWTALVESGVGRLLAASAARDGELPLAAQVPALFGSGAVAQFVAATLEMAVLDAELRASGTPLWSRLGVEEAVATAGVPIGHLVGIPVDRSIDALVARVDELVRAARTARVRVKIEPGWDTEPLRALRDAFPRLVLQADANASYRWNGADPGGGSTGSLDDAARLVELDGLGLSCIEQPLPPGDLAALAQLAARLGTPVALDESLTSFGRVRDALRYGACAVACLKPARLGGLLRAKAAVSVCKESGAGAFVGGFFETGLARAANAALAGLPGFTLPGDLSDPGEYLAQPARVAVYPGLDGALVRPFGGPGLAPPPSLHPDELVRTWQAART
ncbi:MAG: o-succinylbenzoate synthase [Actinomycetota bacterium]|jgi:O-succinylbenzoate synthase|nr:o-succinylbenzoate synthase [Actinomycetota bacterium]